MSSIIISNSIRGMVNMNEPVKKYIGKTCEFSAYGMVDFVGRIISVDGDWAEVEKDVGKESVLVHLRYICRIREIKPKPAKKVKLFGSDEQG